MPAAPLADEAPGMSVLSSTGLPGRDRSLRAPFAPGCREQWRDASLHDRASKLASKRWVYRQYDHMVGADTVRASADVAVVRVHGTDKGLAMTCDCNSQVYLNLFDGAAMALVEAARNLSCVGATPLAITDC